MLQLILSVFTDTAIIYKHFYKLCSILYHTESATDNCVPDEHVCHGHVLVLCNDVQSLSHRLELFVPL